MNQHLACGTHQFNGNALSQSSAPVAPTKYDKQTISEMAVESFLARVTAVTDEETGQYNGTGIAIGPTVEDRFGWCKRTTLRHPPLSPAILELLLWLFNRGNMKGNSKCSAGAMRSVASIYGTENCMFTCDPFWDKAIEKSGGRRIFTDAEIPEEWQIKQYISQMSTIIKSKSKAVAGVQLLTPEEKIFQLRAHLSAIPNLPGDVSLLATTINDLGIELSYIKQKDITPAILSVGIYKAPMKRLIIAACHNVGKRPAVISQSTEQLATTNSATENSEEAEAQQQDEFDVEMNNDDEDTYEFEVEQHFENIENLLL